jgi:AraC family transcriptional regulator of adaptative response/methylated-DNA-[protein]-cysteine methyltransferase|tara:strand:+ start:10664 stop:11257 length:594 start_codon:yes stop_codon:yes gene_type:complete
MQTNLFQETSKVKTDKSKDFMGHFELLKFEKEDIKALNYSFKQTPFGEAIIASLKKGIYYLAFVSSWREGLIDLSGSFPNIDFTEENDEQHEEVLKIIAGIKPKKKIKLFVSGTDFQIEVWQELLKTPFGKTTTYGEIAKTLNLPIGASRAIGTAVGKNPIAYLIPCHRVIQLSGKLGGYRWGIERKKEILTFESNG